MDYSFENVRTSGAYVIFNGYFVFQVGPTKNGDKLGVVRLRSAPATINLLN